MSRNHEAVTFLQALNIKSALFNGFDRVSVFMALKELSDIYEDILNSERNTYFSEVNALRAQLQQAVNYANKCQYEKTRLEKRLADVEAEAHAAASDVLRQRQELEAERKQLEIDRSSYLSEAESGLRGVEKVIEEAARIREQAQREAKRQKPERPIPFSVLYGNKNG